MCDFFISFQFPFFVDKNFSNRSKLNLKQLAKINRNQTNRSTIEIHVLDILHQEKLLGLKSNCMLKKLKQLEYSLEL